MSRTIKLPRIHPIEQAIQLLLEQRRQTDLQIRELRALLPRQTKKPLDKPIKIKLESGKVLEV